MTGFVYAIGDGERRVKIGWSSAPLRRLSKIDSDCPQEVTLLGMVPATKEQEASAHELLARWRIAGEWFRLEGPVEAFVAMLPKPCAAMRGARRKYPDHPLTRWLARNSVTTTRFAERIGVSQGMVSLLCSGDIWPGRETAQNIFRETDGEVTPNDFLELDAVDEIVEAAE